MLCLSVSAELFGNLWQTKHFGIVSKTVLIIKMMKDKSKILKSHDELQPGNKAGQWKSYLLYSFILYLHVLSSRPRSLQAVWPVLPAEVSKPTVAASHWKPEWTESYIRGSVQS